MAFSSQKFIITALILAIAIPISASHRRRWRKTHDPNTDDTEEYLRDLCSETEKSDVCWNILKSDLHRFDGSDEIEIAGGVIDLAAAKSGEIRDQLNQWRSDSDDDRLKEKYRSCSESYNDVNRNLEETRRNLDTDDHGRISDQIDDAEEELEKCRREFDGEFDPGHVGDRNNEVQLYLDMVRAASDRLDGYDEEDDDSDSQIN